MFCRAQLKYFSDRLSPTLAKAGVRLIAIVKELERVGDMDGWVISALSTCFHRVEYPSSFLTPRMCRENMMCMSTTLWLCFRAWVPVQASGLSSKVFYAVHQPGAQTTGMENVFGSRWSPRYPSSHFCYRNRT